MDEIVELSDGAALWTQSAVTVGTRGMVFIHGGPGMWDYLAPVAELVADKVSTHRYDQRGCGRSGASSDYRLARFVADLEELREHFGYRRWFVFGHSFGATLGLAYASAHPDEVAGLIYCDGVGLNWPEHRSAYRARADARLSQVQRARRDQLRELDRSWSEEVEWRTLCWLPDYADAGAARDLARREARTRLDLNLECNRALTAETDTRTEESERAECARVIVPVLLIHGSHDPRPVDGVAELAGALPAATLVVIDGAGHQPWVERPEALRRLLGDVVDG